MTDIREKDFLRHFVLELILVQKDSVFDLWDEEHIELPNDYLSILERVVEDDVRQERYQRFIPKKDRDLWRESMQRSLDSFLKSDGVVSKDIETGKKMTLNRQAISSILYDKSIDESTRINISMLATDFLMVKEMARPKQKIKLTKTNQSVD